MDSNAKNKFRCVFCGRSSPTEHGILDHIRSKHTGLYVSKIKQKGARLYREVDAEPELDSRYEREHRPSQLPHPIDFNMVSSTRGYPAATGAPGSGGHSPHHGYGSYMPPNPVYSPTSGGITLVPSGIDHTGQYTYRVTPYIPPPPPPGYPLPYMQPGPLVQPMVQEQGVDDRQSRPRARPVPSAAQSRPNQAPSVQPTRQPTMAEVVRPKDPSRLTTQRVSQAAPSAQSGTNQVPSERSRAPKAPSAQSGTKQVPSEQSRAPKAPSIATRVPSSSQAR